MIKLSQRSQHILEEFAPEIGRMSLRWKVWITFLLACIIFGLYGLFIMFRDGHGVTGMRDHVVWGIFIANFIFFLGISYAGAIISALFHLFKVPWRRPIMRIATMMAVIGGIVGPFFILLCIGRLDRLHYLFLYPRLQSPIVWDVFAISTYLVAAILFMYLGFIKDFAVFRDYELVNFKGWQRKLYKVLGINYQGKDSQQKTIGQLKNLLALILVPLVVIVSSILSWIFGMTLRPGWHSSIFGPYFVLASIYSGVAAIIILMWVFRKLYNLERFFTNRHFVYMGLALVILGSAYGYFTFSEYLTAWYGSEKWESEVLHKLMDTSEYGWWFFWSSVFGILFPLIVIAFKKLRNVSMITLAAILVLASLWVKRYLIIVPTLESPLLPIQDFRMEYVHYSITWVEWALTIGGAATFLIFYSLMTKIVPIIPVTELVGEEEPVHVEAESVLKLI